MFRLTLVPVWVGAGLWFVVGLTVPSSLSDIAWATIFFSAWFTLPVGIGIDAFATRQPLRRSLVCLAVSLVPFLGAIAGAVYLGTRLTD